MNEPVDVNLVLENLLNQSKTDAREKAILKARIETLQNKVKELEQQLNEGNSQSA